MYLLSACYNSLFQDVNRLSHVSSVFIWHCVSVNCKFCLLVHNQHGVKNYEDVHIVYKATICFVCVNVAGTHNMLSLFCALVTENKVLMFSSSYLLLTSASLGLLSILYPLKFR